MPTKIHHIAVEVSEAERSAAFYCDLLGFTRGDKFVFADRGRTIIFVQLGDTCLELLQDAEYDAHVAQPKMLGFKHVCLQTDDVDADVARLKAAGVTITAEPFDTQLNSRISFLEDPDGLMLELWQSK